MPEIRERRQCCKLVGSERLDQYIATYIDWEASTPPEKFAWRPAAEFARRAKCTCTLRWQIATANIADRDATVDGMYLRILVHANEHMGQLVCERADDRRCASVVQELKQPSVEAVEDVGSA